ncbi:MAG: HEAT repeat domain-containing protein, partial [Blastocatellia bacterium]
VNLLRHVMGEESFWKAIHHYVEKYSWQNVDTGELIDAISESTGQNLQWFFDEWVYKMGHPIFDVTSTYDQAAGAVKLNVKQSQKKDDKSPWYQSPDLFTSPVDVAITTASGEHIQRIWVDKPEQEFTIKVDSKPLIVNFDRGDYVIKELNFSKPDDELAYQAEHDSDVMGRIWALSQLKTKKGTLAEEAIEREATHDTFWGARLEAIRDMIGMTDDSAKSTLLSALKDKDSRVRGEAVQHLGSLKDKSLAPTFTELIKSDPSYLVVSRAAIGLGQTGSSDGYPVLMSLMNENSWQDNLRGAAMRGLAALKDPRVLDMALKYAAPGHTEGLRGASFLALAQVGKGNDQATNLLIGALKEPSEQVVFAAVQALGELGDARAIPAIEELETRPDLPGFVKPFLDNVINGIKNKQKDKS